MRGLFFHGKHLVVELEQGELSVQITLTFDQPSEAAKIAQDFREQLESGHIRFGIDLGMDETRQ